MHQITQESLWFDTPDTFSLCRNGGNGPNHPSQLNPLIKYFNPLSDSILDYGSGSATTFEALKKEFPDVKLQYRGLDVIEKNTIWCQENFSDGDFKFNPTIHKIDEPDQSWDLVYSRHVVDHMESFEKAMDEHCRVAKKFVVVVFWVPLSEGEEHQIKHIVDQGKVYENEYTNQYSRKKVEGWLLAKTNNGWRVKEFTEGIGVQVKGHDWALVLERI